MRVKSLVTLSCYFFLFRSLKSHISSITNMDNPWSCIFFSPSFSLPKNPYDLHFTITHSTFFPLRSVSPHKYLTSGTFLVVSTFTITTVYRYPYSLMRSSQPSLWCPLHMFLYSPVLHILIRRVHITLIDLVFHSYFTVSLIFTWSLILPVFYRMYKGDFIM